MYLVLSILKQTVFNFGIQLVDIKAHSNMFGTKHQTDHVIILLYHVNYPVSMQFQEYLTGI